MTGFLCAMGLVLVFVAQHADVAGRLGMTGMTAFYFNRTLRFLINDGLTIGLIWALFNNRQYVIFALWVQLFGMLTLLLPYFALKYFFPAYNGPLISFLHRLILNPTLLLLLIPALYLNMRNRPAS